jgi:hypothetical protein
VAEVLGESTVQASGPDAPTVEITFTLRFDAAAAGYTYLVDAAATDDAGDGQDFYTVGTVSVASPLSCSGDCSHDGMVSVDELVTGVSIALGAADASRCPDIDLDGNGTVEVNEIVAAIDEALEGCP